MPARLNARKNARAKPPPAIADLQLGLPGVGPNVPAERLRTMEGEVLIAKRRLAPPAASTVYELTELGLSLRPVLVALFQWGLHVIDAPTADDTIKASYWLPALQTAAQTDVLPAGVRDTYEFRIGEEVLSVDATSEEVEVREGASESPDVVLHTDAPTFVAMGRGELLPLAAIEAGKLSVEGDEAAAERCAAVFAADK